MNLVVIVHYIHIYTGYDSIRIILLTILHRYVPSATCRAVLAYDYPIAMRNNALLLLD